MHLSRYIIIHLSLLTIISSENIISVKKEPSQDVVKIINELNHYLDIEWNLVFILEAQLDGDVVQQSLAVPVIILTKASDMRIHLLYSHKLMSVVFRHEVGSKKSYGIVEEQLQWLTVRPILWITPEAKEEDLLNFARSNWFSGFVQALFFTRQGLFIYNPVPDISIERVRSIEDYVQKKQIVDFKKYPLNFLTVNEAPYCFPFQDHWGKIAYTGYFYKALQIFMKHYNFQANPVVLFDRDDPSSTYSLNELFKSNTIDIVPASFYDFYSEYATKSKVIWNTRIYILAPYPSSLSKLSYLHYPFTFSTKITIALLIFLYAAALMFIYNRSNSENNMEFIKAFLYVLASLMFQNHFNFKVQTTRQKAVVSLLFFSGFILTNLYLAKLSSIMVKHIYDTKIEKLDDLNRTSLNIIMIETVYQRATKYHYLNSNILKKAKVVEKAYMERAKFDMNNTYLLIVIEETMKFLFFQQKFLKTPRMYNIEEDMIVEPNSFTIRRNLPYVQLFNRYLSHIQESGIIDKILSDTYLDGIRSGKLRFFMDNGEDLFLNWESFYAIATCFIFGMTFSSVVFILELAYHKYAMKRFTM